MRLQGENMTHRVEVEGGGYLGLMAVWHNLHCLNVLRKVVNVGYYGKWMGEEKVWGVGHLSKFSFFISFFCKTAMSCCRFSYYQRFK